MSQYGMKLPREQAANVFDRIVRSTTRLAVELYGVDPGQSDTHHTWRLLACGSLRRGRPLVGDLDLVVDGSDGAWVDVVCRAVRGIASECRITKEGKLKGATIDGVPVELYAGRPGAFGAQVLFCTGSATFNIRQRAVATRMGLMLNQYGVHEETIDAKGKRAAGNLIASATEEEMFEALGMKYLHPKERE